MTIAIAVRTEVSRRAVKLGITPASAEKQLVNVIANRLAIAIRTRVQQRGDLAGQQFPGWETRHPFYATSPRYPDRAHGRVGRSGAEFFPSSAEYHRQNATRPGTYSTTGGMWDGLSVVIQSATRATIQFRGRSEGAAPNWRNKKVRPLKVNNALKAATILRQHGVNVLQLTRGELDAVTRASQAIMTASVGEVLPVDWRGWSPGGRNLAAVVNAAFAGL